MRSQRARDPAGVPSEAGGVWTFEGGALTRKDDGSTTPAIVLVPTEQVLTLVADLPLPNRVERLAALPFAVEDRIADPLDSVHVALGSEVAPNRHLAGVVRHELMQAWTAEAAAAGLERASIAPDYLALPRPEPGGWRVHVGGERALTRAADGTGFALPIHLLEPAWTSAGRPPVVASGDPLPPGVTAAEAPLALAGGRVGLTPLPLDLRQGLYAVRGRPEGRLIRQLAAVAVLGLSLHTLLFAVDAIALTRMAENRRAETAALVRATAPGLRVDGDLAAELEPLLTRDQAASRSAFLPLFSRSAAALQPAWAGLSLRGLSFSDNGALTLDMQAADLAALQRAQAALTAAGLTVAAGSSATTAGGADGRFTVRAGGGR